MQLMCECGMELNNPPDIGRNYYTECPNPNCRKWLYFNSQEQNLEMVKSIPVNVHPKVFFSHSFKEVDRGLNETFKSLLTFFYIYEYTIERDTRSIDKIQKAREGIKDSDFVFILMPRRYHCYDEESGNNSWKSSEWIQNEVGMAYAYGKDVIAVVEEDVKDEGMLKDIRWCYSFNRDRLRIPWIEDNDTRIPEETKNELIDALDTISRM